MSEHIHGDAPHGGHHDHGHGHHAGGPTHHPNGRPIYFSEQEWADFQRSDRAAGGMVVALMTAIFSVGLVLYTTIAAIVA
jgi:hypothetical protein